MDDTTIIQDSNKASLDSMISIGVEVLGRKKQFYATFNTKNHSWLDFEDIILVFKTLRLKYTSVGQKWGIPFSKVHEVLSWFRYFKWDYYLDPKAEFELDKFFPNETFYSRGVVLNPDLLTTELKEFQKVGVKYFLTRNVGFNADDPGLGKTIQAIGTFAQLYDEGKIDGIFLIVQNGLLYHWKREIVKFTTMFESKDIVLIDNDNKERCYSNLGDAKIIILSSHLLTDSIASYRADWKKIRSKSKKKLRWNNAPSIKKEWNKNNVCLVIDESHGFKHGTSIKTKVLKSIRNDFKYKYLLTATPAINDFTDWFNQIFILDPSIFNTSEKAFSVDLSLRIGDEYSPYAIQEFDINKVKQIESKLKNVVIKRVKSELPEMKTKQIISPRYFQLSRKQRRMYDILYQEEIVRIRKEKKKISMNRVEMIFPYTMQVLENPLLLEGKISNPVFEKLLKSWKITDDERIVFLDNYLDDMDIIGEKVIIYDSHPLTLNMLHDRYKKCNPLVIHGQLGQTQKERQYIQDLFNDKHNEHRLILLSAQTSSSGINLQEGGNRIIFYSAIKDVLLVRQGMDRTFRINSVDDSLVIFLLFDNTFDIVQFERIQNRLELNEKFLSEHLSESELHNLMQGIL